MEFLEANDSTFKAIQGYCNPNGRFEFRELPDGRKVVNEDILTSPDFPELIPQLSKLPKTTFDEND